jgi:hypothetical protein
LVIIPYKTFGMGRNRVGGVSAIASARTLREGRNGIASPRYGTALTKDKERHRVKFSPYAPVFTLCSFRYKMAGSFVFEAQYSQARKVPPGITHEKV